VQSRRLILLFFMVLLPLQWSWAAAARVCQHEAGGGHFGHHVHTHTHAHALDAAEDAAEEAEEEAANSADTPSSSLQEHPDCPSCHGLGAVCVSVALPPWPQVQAAAPPRGPLPWPARVRADGVLRPPQIFLA